MSYIDTSPRARWAWWLAIAGAEAVRALRLGRIAGALVRLAWRAYLASAGPRPQR